MACASSATTAISSWRAGRISTQGSDIGTHPRGLPAWREGIRTTGGGRCPAWYQHASLRLVRGARSRTRPESAGVGTVELRVVGGHLPSPPTLPADRDLARSPPRFDARPARPALDPRAVGGFRRACAGLVRQPRRAPARASRRGPVRGDRTRDGGVRRLGDAAPERPQVPREAALPVLGNRRRLPCLRRPRMDGAALARARGVSRRGCHRLRRRCAGRGRAGRVRRPRAGRNALARRDGADRLARLRARVLSGARLRWFRDRAAIRCNDGRASRVDVGRLGRTGGRDAVERADRDRAALRRARRLHRGHARFHAVAAAAHRVGCCALPPAGCAVVRRRCACERRVSRVLLRARARPALPHHRAPAARPVVLLHSRPPRRGPAMVDRIAARRAPHLA